MYTSTRQDPSGIRAGTLDALRVQLLKMSPQQLQAFAMANQDDAIKLGLAAEADKVHKKHAQEYMALQMGQQPKPPVAQQILQSIGQTPPPPQQPMPPQGMPPQGMPPQGMPPQGMPPQGMADGGYLLPEDQGIATLPVGDMDFAEGGIVAFGGGGEVPGYAGGVFTGNPEEYIYTGGIGQPYYIDVPSYNPRKPVDPAVAALKGRKFATKEDAINAINALSNPAAARPSGPFDYPVGVKVASPKPLNIPPPPPSGDKKAPPPPPPPAQKPAGLPTLTAPKITSTVIPDITPEEYRRQLDAATPKEIVDPLAAQRAEANAPAIQAAARQVSLFEQEVQKRQPAFEERLRKLDEKEERVNTMADRNLNMSLIEAGLAMMSGESPHAFVNIGKGAQVGMKSYAEGQAKVEAARDKMEEARARIEEFRRNEDMMTSKERRAILRDYDNTVAAASKDMFSGVEKMYGINREDARSAIAAKQARDLAQAQISSRENVSLAELTSRQNISMAEMQNQRDIEKMRLAAPPAEARMAMMLGTGKTESERLESGLRKIQDLQSDKTGKVYAELYAKHVEDSRKNLTEPMSPTEFATSMRAVLAAMSPKPPPPLNQPAGQVRQ